MLMLVIKSCRIHLSYTRTKALNPPQISTINNHNAVTCLYIDNLILSGHKFKQEVSITFGNLVIKPLISVNLLNGDEFTCERCGESHSELEADGITLNSSSCLFCRRLHICGDFVAMFSSSVEIKICFQKRVVSVKVLGAFLMSREVNLWTFGKCIYPIEGLQNDLPIQDRVPHALEPTTTSFIIDFLPSPYSKSKSAISINLFRQPLERSLSLTVDTLRFSKSSENIVFNLDNLQLLSGLLMDTCNASREFSIEHMEFGSSLSEEKVNASLTLQGIFLGLAQDPVETAFFAALQSTIHSIFLSHSWLLSGNKSTVGVGATGPKSLEEKSIHASIHLKTSLSDSAIRLVFIPDTPTPALVHFIGQTKLAVTLPSAVSETLNFVFETNSFSLYAILPKYRQMNFCLNQKGQGDSISSVPISNLFATDVEYEKRSKLYDISQFSAWCHADVFGFRISDVAIEMPSSLMAKFHSHLQKIDSIGLSGLGGTNRAHRRSGRFLRRWFNVATVTSLQRFTLDGHFETLQMVFISSCGARIECGLTRAHCSASPLPHFSPSRTPFSLSSQRQQSNSSPTPLFLEFTVSNSEFQMVIPTPSKSINLLTMPAFQVCCNLALRSVEVSIIESVDLRLDPGTHICVLEFLLLARNFLRRRLHVETIEAPPKFPPTSATASMWSVDIHNTSVTRLAYESGRHSVAVMLHGCDVCLASSATNRHKHSLKVKSPKVNIICDGREVALIQVLIQVLQSGITYLPTTKLMAIAPLEPLAGLTPVNFKGPSLVRKSCKYLQIR
ncbi:unnamed protein product [Rodentolepis nana]|uniref:Fmp27_GFWDK domain-containing protein n=1 Tax=Rodentolepis nana TaxID=102285 RepID=A0A0R3T5D6_RODNA|nr:unnamed protein product [Rodentolepis nana]